MRKLAPRKPDLLSPAIRAALAAGKVLMKYHERVPEVRSKGSAGLVTQADLEAEAAAMKVLRRARPDFGFLAEETATDSSQSSAEGRWIIDPLDGTTNFVHGFPMFCVSIGVQWQGELAAGVIYHPVLKDLYTATRGGGAWLNKRRRLRVSKTPRLSDALLTTGFTYRKNEWLKKEMEAFERLSEIARAVRRPGSAALDLAYVARGVFDGFWERRLSPWDVAAGVLLVREAGGEVSNFKGGPFDLEDPELIASNAALHLPMRQVIAPEFCPLPPRS